MLRENNCAWTFASVKFFFSKTFISPNQIYLLSLNLPDILQRKFYLSIIDQFHFRNTTCQKKGRIKKMQRNVSSTQGGVILDYWVWVSRKRPTFGASLVPKIRVNSRRDAIIFIWRGKLGISNFWAY